MILSMILAAGVFCGFEKEGQPAKSATNDREVNAILRDGKPIVIAVYRFKHENGLWPSDLNELIPDYLTRAEIRGWLYQSWYDGGWILTNFGGYPNYAIRYFHRPSSRAEWQKCEEDRETPLEVEQTIPKWSRIDEATVAKRMQNTILRRIQQNPKQIIHHKGLISRLFAKGDFNEARHKCRDCLRQWPDLWWPNVMLALIETRLGKTTEAEEKLLPWVRKHNDFQHWFFAAYFYQAAGQTEKCIAALRKASESELDDLTVKWQETEENFGSVSGELTAMYASLLAFQEQRLDLCLAICARWEHYIKNVKKYGGPHFHVVRAACYLRQGKITEAKTAIEIAARTRENYGSEFDRQVAELRQAIEDRNTAYRYAPRDRIDKSRSCACNLLVEYQ